MVSRLVSNCDAIADSALWSSIIVHLVREVVSSVDPNVRSGDSLDIRPYVKIKTIPGGSIDENCYVNGVVFRKNVSHKKMAADGNKINPRILLLSGSIDFQRTDNRLASMDTLIEQEDKYIELLIEKIMSLKPDIILVGKAVARRAQELLCSHKVVVMQNVKPQLLERISRMTGAIMLQSTDHMIQQYGEECLGTCGQFKLRLVQDNPEKSNLNAAQANRVLRTRIMRGSTYAYFQGCPSERGCTLVLRGAEKSVLVEVKKIISFSVMLAYHLRLEVAYYNDRFAQLPNVVDTANNPDDSDVEDDDSQKASWELRECINRWYGRKAVISINGIMTENGSSSDTNVITDADHAGDIALKKEQLHREARLLLSSSLDVDIGLAYINEIRGMPQHVSKSQLLKVSCLEHQSLLVTTLLMGEGTQKSRPEVKGIRFYTPQDVALGHFLIENCFQLHKVAVRESSMIDQILSFAHRNSRLDITVRKVGNSTSLQFEDGVFVARDPMNLPILMHSFCKECQQAVTPEVLMSDETWKMSFGKFMEICFYNRSALGRTNGCVHCIHESHTLLFSCEGYEARFDIIPLHPYSLHVRTNLGDFPTDTHAYHAAALLTQLPVNIIEMVDNFLRTVLTLENIARDVMTQRPEEFEFVCQDFRDLEAEIKSTTTTLIEDICRAAEWLSGHGGPRAANKLGSKGFRLCSPAPSLLGMSPELKPSQQQPGHALIEDIASPVPTRDNSHDSVRVSEVLTALSEDNDKGDDASTDKVFTPTSAQTGGGSRSGSDLDSLITPTAGMVEESTMAVVHDVSEVSAVAVAVATTDESKYNFPMYFKREAYLKARQWNMRLETAYRYIEQVRQEMLLALQQAQTGTPMPNMAALQITPLHGISEAVNETEEDADDESGSNIRSSQSLKRATSNSSGSGSNSNSYNSTSALPPPPTTPTSSPSRPTREESNSSASSEISAVEPLPPAGSVLPAIIPPRPEFCANSVPSSPTLTPREPKADDSVEPSTAGTVTVPETDVSSEVGDTTALGMSPERKSMTLEPILSTTSMSLIGNRSSTFNTESGESATENSFPGKKVRPISTNLSGRGIAPVPISADATKGASKSSSTYRLPKALARFVMGKDADNEDARPKSIVPLGVMEEGRLGLKAGRHGEVIAIHEDEPATIIAYSLASEEYYKELQKFFGASDADMTVETTYNDASALLMMQASHTLDEGAKAPKDLISGRREGESGGNAVIKEKFNDNDLDDDQHDNSTTSGNSSKVGKAFSGQVVDAADYNANANFNSFAAVFGNSSALAASPEAADKTGNDNSDPAGVPVNVASNMLPGIAHTASTIGVAATPVAAAASSRTSNEVERQMLSQRKLHARHSFEDIDDKGHTLCKYICTSYWAGQFEAVRAGYLKEEDNVGFIKSLSMSSRWGAQGGKSGANFSKSLDERFVLKVISKVELQMFLEFAPAYFGMN
jgi:hypothetical protein